MTTPTSTCLPKHGEFQFSGQENALPTNLQDSKIQSMATSVVRESTSHARPVRARSVTFSSVECKIRWDYRGVDEVVLDQDALWNERKAPDMKHFKTAQGEPLQLEPGDYLFPIMITEGSFPLERFYLPGSLVRDLRSSDYLSLQYKDRLVRFQIEDPDFASRIEQVERRLYETEGAVSSKPISLKDQSKEQIHYPHPRVQAEKKKNDALIHAAKQELQYVTAHWVFTSEGSLERAVKAISSSEIKKPQIIHVKAVPTSEHTAEAQFDMGGAGAFQIFICQGKVFIYKTDNFTCESGEEMVQSQIYHEKLAIIDCFALKRTVRSIERFENNNGVIHLWLKD